MIASQSSCRQARNHRFAHRPTFLTGVSVVALLMAAPDAYARPLGGSASASAAAGAVAVAQSGAQAAAQQGQNSLWRTTQAIQAMQAAQAAARAAANIAPSAVPNGLGLRGLQVAPGAVPGSDLWRGANLPTEALVNGRTKVDIKQTQQKAILTWQTFNVGRETDLSFDQKAGGADASKWSVLNRVLDPSLAPSRILGTVTADGAVYVINRNGIIFGGASQVNVGSLIASSLDIHGGAIEYQAGATELQKLAARNQRFIDGILAANPPSNQSVPLTFFDDTNMNAYADRVKPGETFVAYDGVTVEAGAQIAVGGFGQAVLMGHNVVNRGRIDAPDGQVLMAAGRGVLLLDGTKRDALKDAYSADIGGAPIRGFLAGVDRGGFAENAGLIITERGNITLTGANVSQDGVLISTTAAEAAGSILIQAQSGMVRGANHTRDLTGNPNNPASLTEGMFPNVSGSGGTAEFGEGSYAAILPDFSGEKVVGNPYKPSTVEVYGNGIVFRRDATLYVPAGAVRLTGVKKNGQLNTVTVDDSRIYLDSGSVLDVSGLRDVEIAMEQNIIRAELRANELRDNPVMRDSGLRGTAVYFDARYGTKLIDGTGLADLSGYYDLIARDVAQFMTVGGKISMSGMEVIARQGSLIDLSGGSVRYLDGYVRSTRLIGADGRLVPIEQAQAGVKYLGLEGDFIRDHARWGITESWGAPFGHSGFRFEEGYTEGRSAGSLLLNNVVTTSLGGRDVSVDAIRIFDGDVRADIVVGERQRDASTEAGVTDVTRIWRERPSSATLSVGSNYRISFGQFDANPIGGNIIIGGDGPRLGQDFDAATALLDYTHNLTSLYGSVQAYQHVLPGAWFDGSTFSNVTLISGGGTNGVLTVGEGKAVDVGAFGSFTFIGRQAEIDGAIRAPGGKVHVEALRSTSPAGSTSIAWDQIPEAQRPIIHLGDSGVIDVAGRWTSDRSGAGDELPVLNGGKVELISRSIVLDKGSLIDASGGAQLLSNGKIVAGNGGSILIDTVTPYTSTSSAAGLANGRLEMNGDIVAYALGRGGSLTIDTPDDMVISDHTISFADGVLPAGTAAPRNMMLTADFTLQIGDVLPVDVQYVVNRLGPGEKAPVDVTVSLGASTVTIGAGGLVVPPGMRYRKFASVIYYGAGETIPAGTRLYGTATLAKGFALPIDLFPSGSTITAVTLTKPAGSVADVPLTLKAGTIIPVGSVLSSASQVSIPNVLNPDFFTKGGFATYALSGARGMTVTSGTVIAPTVDTLVLNVGAFQALSGARLYDLLNQEDGVALRNSSELPAGLRQPMELTLGTAPFSPSGTARPARVTGAYQTSEFVTVARHPGKLVVETGAEILMDAESTVRLDSLVDVFVDGTISTPGGTIHILPNGTQSTFLNASVRLGANARLLAGGYQQSVPTPNGELRSVEAGGLVQIGVVPKNGDNRATQGTVLIDQHAVIDVSGVHGIADLDRGGSPTLANSGGSYTPVEVDGAAGSIRIYANNGVIAGDLRLSPGGASGYGGTLTVATGFTYPQLFAVVVAQTAPAGFAVTPSSPASGYSSLLVAADTVNRSGADDLSLLPAEFTNNRGIIFDGDVTLATRRSITLASYNLSTGAGVSAVAGLVNLASSYVHLQGFASDYQGGMTAPAGTDGQLTIRADLIDVSGGTKLGGFGKTSFVATGDIRLSGNSGTAGTLTTAGSFVFDSAQVYAALGWAGPSLQDDPRELPDTSPGFLVNAGVSIIVDSNHRPAPVPLSYGQRLTLRAPIIDQNGVIRAPQGQIRLEASQTLTLRPGSLTSASLEGLTVPFGYLTSDGLFRGYHKAGYVPTKSVKLAGADVDVQQGAVVDVSGGGDLLGWSFVGGNGGSVNILANTSVERYAIVPSFGAAPAPTSDNAPAAVAGTAPLQDSRLKVGDTVYLQGVPGLAAGYYTLLPAHYALLAGGMLVEPLGGSFAAAAPTVNLADGSVLTSGYRAVAGSSIREAGFSRFKVMDAATWTQYSQFNILSFNTSAHELAQAAELATVRTPQDAGVIMLAASNSLNLAGTGRLGAGADGLLGNLDISAAKIALVSGSTATTAGVLRLDAQQLESFGAGSVLIGGTRSYSATGTTVAVGASEVTVDENARFTAPEIILAASGLVDVRGGASLTAEGSATVDTNPLLMSGNGALLRLSTGQRVGLVRTGSNGGAGVLAVADDAALRSSGSISFDGSNAINLSARAIIQATQLDLASSIVNLGDVPSGAIGTTFTEAMLERFAAASDVLIRGHQSINLYGTFDLGRRDANGAATLKALTLDTGLLQGVGASARLPKITAQSLSLRNSGAAASYAGPDTAASLNLDVDRLLLGPGNVSLGGFYALQGRVGELRASGQGGLNVVTASGGGAGYVSLDVGRVTAAAASDYAITASGILQLNAGSSASAPAEAPFGGRLTLQGTSVTFGTQALLPAGVIDIRATSGDLVVGDGAVLDVSGRAVDFRDVVRFAPGGGVRLQAPGLVSLAAGSLVDVSGSARGGDAGRIDIVANSAQIDATLRANAASGYAGGSFTLDADQLAGSFSNLAGKLGSGSFDREISVRLRAQDIALAAGERLEAHRVMLRSDSGWVDLGGTIDASGDAVIADGGDVRLIGEEGVRLRAGARIEAQAGTAPAGGYASSSGYVELASTGTRNGIGDAKGIDVAAGALIDVSGGREGGGRILMRANYVPASGEDVGNVFRIAAGNTPTYAGAREKVLVGVQNYDVASVDAARVTQVMADLQSMPANAVAGFASMGGTLFRNKAGDLTIAADIDLGGTTLNRPSWMGFEATQDILVNGTISDGFASAAKTAALKSITPSAGSPVTGTSFNLNFESGRDIVVGAGAIIRTGTGEIRMDAGRDLVLASNTSAIYTAGVKTPTVAGFVVGTKQGDYPTAGGNIILNAGQDITAPIVRQSTAAWLYHYGETNWAGDPAASTVKDQTSWSIVFANFESGVGVLGGGDVRVRAGRDSKDLSVAIPTTGHLTTPTTPQGQAGPVATVQDLYIRGGGNLDIRTGRELLGGVYMLGRGHAELSAGGRITASGTLAPQRTGNWTAVPPYTTTTASMLLGLMDATVSLSAIGGVAIEGIYDPMLIGQVAGNRNGNVGSGFMSFSEKAAVDTTSVGGDVVYYGNPWRASDLSLGGAYEVQVKTVSTTDPRPLLQERMNLLPPTLRLASLQSDVSIAAKGRTFVMYGPMLLAPGATGTLELLANENVLLSQALMVRLDDTGLAYRRGPLAPFGTDNNVFLNLGLGSALRQPIGANTNWERGFDLLHANDADPVRLYALNGTIGTILGWGLTAPKPVDVFAGKDILYGAIIAQNNNPLQVSSVIAGRDIIRPQIAFLGQGSLWVEAGRNVTLNAHDNIAMRGSIMSTGNVLVSGFTETRAGTDNPNLALPDKGGNINIIAGTAGGADYAGFADLYLDPRNASDPALPLSNPANAGKVVRTYEKELADFLKGLGYDDRPADEQRALFASLPKLTREAFLQKVLFTELKETGIDYNNADSLRFKQYTRGYAAIQRLFPMSPDAVNAGLHGDVTLRGGVVQTQSGGDISIMAPYGKVVVGYDSELAKNLGLGGVVTRRGGDVRIMADGSIDLYVSRVFTLQGGDLTMWTSNGNISAGSGAKTSVFNVPLRFRMDNDARVSVDAFGLSTGAGIGVLDALQDSRETTAQQPPWNPPAGTSQQDNDGERKKSRMDLLAFKGEINAGDAGIRVVGDLNIAALRIVNAANITVSGAATGVPTVQAPNIGGLTEASNVAGSAAQAAAPPSQSRAGEQQSIIIVEVLGFGGGDGNGNGNGNGQEKQRDENDPRQRRDDEQTQDLRNRYQVIGAGVLTNEQTEQLAAENRKLVGR